MILVSLGVFIVQAQKKLSRDQEVAARESKAN